MYAAKRSYQDTRQRGEHSPGDEHSSEHAAHINPERVHHVAVIGACADDQPDICLPQRDPNRPGDTEGDEKDGKAVGRIVDAEYIGGPRQLGRRHQRLHARSPDDFHGFTQHYRHTESEQDLEKGIAAI